MESRQTILKNTVSECVKALAGGGFRKTETVYRDGAAAFSLEDGFFSLSLSAFVDVSENRGPIRRRYQKNFIRLFDKLGYNTLFETGLSDNGYEAYLEFAKGPAVVRLFVKRL